MIVEARVHGRVYTERRYTRYLYRSGATCSTDTTRSGALNATVGVLKYSVVSVGSLWHQIKEALEHEEYVDLTKTPASTDTNRPIDDIAAIRMRKKLESRRKSRAAA